MMRFFSTLSIKGKLIIINLAIILPVLTTVTLLYISVDAEILKNQFISKMAAVGDLTSNYSAPDLMFVDREAAQETLSKLEDIEDIKGAILFNSQKQRFASYGIVIDSIRPQEEELVIAKNQLVFVYSPVKFQGNTVGFLTLIASTKNMDHLINDRFLEVFFYLVLASAFVILLTFLFQGLILSPIHSVINVVNNAIQKDDYTERIRVHQKHEIGELYSGVNNLLDKVEYNTVSRKLSAKFLELTNENVMVLDENQKIIFLSESFSKLVQYREKDLLNQKIDKIINDSALAVKFAHKSAQSDEYMDFNTTLILHNHKLLPVHIKAFLLDEDSHPQYICLIETI
ncbi:MAG: PAS domain-containing protein [Cytophagales bacterium]|nr:PAS domain-containing protein [Cytophagales bacterium]